MTRAFETVKDAFDPGARLNPNKIVRPLKSDDCALFRFKPGYAVTRPARALPPEIVRGDGRGRDGAAPRPGLDLRVIESSCCGMAGAFGYRADTIDVSVAMAELSLFPALRKAGPDDLVVADSTSCRHQIHDGLQREALHVARVLDVALVA